MAQIQFDPTNPEKLRVDISYQGVFQASYIYTLWEAFSNEVVDRHEGNNLNPYDDSYNLPQPSSSNLNRVIEVRSSFYGHDVSNFPDYTIQVEVFQGNSSLGIITDPLNPPGTLTGDTQNSVIFIELIK